MTNAEKKAIRNRTRMAVSTVKAMGFAKFPATFFCSRFKIPNNAHLMWVLAGRTTDGAITNSLEKFAEDLASL